MKLVLAVGILMGAMSAIGAYAGDSAIVFSRAQGACSDDESWDYGSAVPPAWQQRLAKKPDGLRAAVLLYTNASAMKAASSRSAEALALSEYALARSLYAMKLVHAAFARFNAVLGLPTQSGTAGVKIAALQCLSRIASAYPTLFSPAEALRGLEGMQDIGLDQAQRKILWKALADGSTRLPPNSPQWPWIRAMLEPSGSYRELAALLEASRRESEPEVIQHAEIFLKGPVPDELSPKQNLVRLLLGEALYSSGKYAEAARAFRLVENSSNYLAQSLTGMAWSFLQNKQEDEALGASRNLLMGSLGKTFAPEASLVGAIAFAHMCHYATALQSVELFRKHYKGVYKWLYFWNKKRLSEVVAGNLYSQAMAYLKSNPERVPDPIGTEWIRSPVFLADQEEINLLYDEKAALGATRKFYSQFVRANARLAKYLTQLRQDLVSTQGMLPRREPQLVAQINRDLSARNQLMLAQVAEQWENSQLVEVEAYNQVGDKMVADFVSSEYKKLGRKTPSSPRPDDGPVWDWGRAPASDDGSGETWQDELGFLKVKLTDNCDHH